MKFGCKQISTFFYSNPSPKFRNIAKKIFLKLHKSLDLVHPCYNPHLHWAKDLVYYYGLFVNLLPKDLPITVYVVNDGSSQGINEQDILYLKAQIPHFTYIDLPKNLGKGGALREAIRKTT